MSIVVEATYEDGVLRPLQRVDIREHDRVRLTVEPVDRIGTEEPRRRIRIDPEIGRAIAEDPEFSLWG